MNPRDLPEVTAGPPAGHRTPTSGDPRCTRLSVQPRALHRPAVRRAVLHHRRQAISGRHGGPSTRSGEPTRRRRDESSSPTSPARPATTSRCGSKLTAAQTVLGALLILREQHGHSAAVRVLRYAACYLQIPQQAVAPTPAAEPQR